MTLLPHAALSHHPSHTHTYSHSGSTPSNFSSHCKSKLMRGGSTRLISAGDPVLAGSQMLAGPARHKSHESLPEPSKIAEQRRKSGDMSFFHTHKQDLGGRCNCSHKHDHSQTQVNPNPDPDQIELSGGNQLESGSSPTLNHADTMVTPRDERGEGDRRKISASYSTLIECGSPPREVKEKLLQVSLPTGRQNHNVQHELSQERFGDDDRKEMFSLSTLAEGHGMVMPLSNYYPLNDYESYYGEHQEGFQPRSFTAKQGQDQSLFHDLSQPSSASPPKSYHGKSFTDLTSGNGSLSCSQHFLSQSVADFQHMQQHHTESSHHTTTNQRRHREHRFRGPPLSNLSSDPLLSKTHVPGLKRSVIHALSDVREVEQRGREKKRSPSTLHSSPQLQLHRPSHSSLTSSPRILTWQKKHVEPAVQYRRHSQKRMSADLSPHNQK